MKNLLTTMISEGTIIAVASSLATIFGLLIKSWYDLKCREEDRKDREQLAKFTEEQIASLLEAGSAREKKIVKEIINTRIVNVRALKEANNVNKKIESLGETLVNNKTKE